MGQHHSNSHTNALSHTDTLADSHNVAITGRLPIVLRHAWRVPSTNVCIPAPIAQRNAFRYAQHFTQLKRVAKGHAETERNVGAAQIAFARGLTALRRRLVGQRRRRIFGTKLLTYV